MCSVDKCSQGSQLINITVNPRKHIWGPCSMQKWKVNLDEREAPNAFAAVCWAHQSSFSGPPIPFKSGLHSQLIIFLSWTDWCMSRLALLFFWYDSCASCYLEWICKSASSLREIHYSQKNFGWIIVPSLLVPERNLAGFPDSHWVGEKCQQSVAQEPMENRQCLSGHTNISHQLLQGFGVQSSQGGSCYKHQRLAIEWFSVCSFFCSFTACPTAGKHCFPRITPLEETLFLFNIGSVSSFILPTSGLHPCYIHLKSFFQSLGAIFLHFPKDTSPPKILFQQAHESVYI